MHVSTLTVDQAAMIQLASTRFRSVERQIAMRLAQQGSLHRFEPDHVIFHEGDEADSVYKIVKGMVKLYKLLPDGRRQITGFVGEGTLIGLSSDEVFVHTAETVNEALILRFPRGRFERFVDEVPGFARWLLAVAQDELSIAQEQLLLLGRKTATERIASFLTSMAERLGEHGLRSAVTFPVPMKRSDIADYLGLTIETVSRGLSRLKKDGVIEDTHGGRFMTADLDRLTDLAAGEESLDA